MSRATGPWTSPLPPAVVDPVITMLTKFELEGNFQNQPFIAYGALFAAPARDDSLVASRRDYTYAVSSSIEISPLSTHCLMGIDHNRA